MFDFKCRLCSSSCALISLFNGKSRSNREYIRKLVEITTGIKFEKDDAYKCICYTCTIQVYNFYIFKTRSIENEKIIEAQVKKDKKGKFNKSLSNLDNIILPDIKELQDTLAPWLISKQIDCNIVSNECTEETTNKFAEQNNFVKNPHKTVEKSIQCDEVQTCDISVQCRLRKDVCSKSTQSTIKNTLNRSVQCVAPNTTSFTQTNEITTKSRESQCSLSKEWTRDCDTQTQLRSLDKMTQHCNNCDASLQETDCKCLLVSVKQEPLTPLRLSPTNLSISRTPIPNSSCSSPVSPNLLAIRSKYENVIICQQCDQTLYTKNSYQLHKKSHMVCTFCKKKFSTMKRTKWHIENDCSIKKMMKEPVVQLERIEQSKHVRKRYFECLDDVKTPKMEMRNGSPSVVRLRSRSTSSVDSVYSSCSFCKNSVTILHGLTLGIDKSVQTSLWIDKKVVAGLVNGDAISKTVFENQECLTPSKKIKLSRKPVRKSVL